MPELPEVETFARFLNASPILGVPVKTVRVLWPRSVRGITPGRFVRRMSGAVITHVRRRGKWLVFDWADGDLAAAHLRMSGRFGIDGHPRAGPHDRVLFTFENGLTLHFNDPRKFGRWLIGDAARRTLNELGPEPLSTSFTARQLHDRLSERKRQLKPLLLDQQFLAGLGNIYVDESLWQARLHPLRRSDTLSREEAGCLYRAIRRVLRKAIRHEGTSLGEGRSNYLQGDGRPGGFQYQLNVYGREGSSCKRCGEEIVKAMVGQRSTRICPACQNVMAAYTG